ncbi:MAG: hypothetical protein ACI4T1_01520 [Christensenellales bacterium]
MINQNKENVSDKKFITEKTDIKISKDRNTVVFTNKYENGKTKKITLHLRDKKN